MKKIVILLALLFSVSMAETQQLYTDTQIDAPFNSLALSFHYPSIELAMTVDIEFSRMFRTQVDLDRTLFGRAMSGMGQTVRQAWSQGYTGQNVNIAIVDFIKPTAPKFSLTLSNVNRNPQALTHAHYTVEYIYENTPQLNRTLELTSEADTPWRVTNNRTFSGNFTHWEFAAILAGGRHVDADGTVLYGIAKDANITLLHYNQPSYVNEVSRKPFDFINASLSLTIPDGGAMETVYTTIDNSGIYPDGHLPVYITAGGNTYYTIGTPTYSGLEQGLHSIADYHAVTMAMSDNTYDDRPLSDYLLIVGADHGITNRPGEVVELQRRWIVAPYQFPHDGGTLQGTSFSAPFVTGIASVVKSKFPTLAPADVANLLLETARDVGAPGMDAIYGRGMVDLANALSPQ